MDVDYSAIPTVFPRLTISSTCPTPSVDPSPSSPASASSSPASGMDVQCPICFSRWSEGTLFSLATGCGHSVCEVCAEKVTQCPTCRKSIGTEVGKSNHYIPNFILNDGFEFEAKPKSTPTLTEVFAKTARDIVDEICSLVREEIDMMASGEKQRSLKDTLEFIFEREKMTQLGGGEIGDIAMEALCMSIQSEVACHFGDGFIVRVCGVTSRDTRYHAVKVRAQLRKGFSVPPPVKTPRFFGVKR